MSRLLGVHTNTLRRWDRTGRLRPVRVGRRGDRRYYRQTIERLRALKTESNRPQAAVTSWRPESVLGAFLGLLLLLTVVPVKAESVDRRTFVPVECAGWANPAAVDTVELPSSAPAARFSGANSAYFIAPAGATDVAALNAGGGSLRCLGWNIPERGLATAVKQAELRLSLAAVGSAEGEDVLVLRTSNDGQHWTNRWSSLLRGETSNGRNGGYLTLPLDDLGTIDQLRSLQVELMLSVSGTATPAKVFLDGLSLTAEVTPAAKTRRQQLDPTACVGWSNAAAARSVDERGAASLEDFSDHSSAVIRRTSSHDDGLEGAGSLPVSLTCAGFGVLGKTQGKDIVDASIGISFAARSSGPGIDVLTPEYSLDSGLTWQAGEPVSLPGEASNATRGGYGRLELPAGLSRESLAPLLVRVTFNQDVEPSNTTVLVDGMFLDLSAASVKGSDQSFFGLSFLTKRSFLPLEEPVLILDEGSLQSVEVFDANGAAVDLPYTHAGVAGSQTKITFVRGREIRPGIYTVRLKTKSGRRTLEETQTFAWGLAALNTPKSSYLLGESIPVVVGVVDERGRTVCDADLALRITSPSGVTRSLTTQNGEVTASKTCGPKSITADPDYLVRFVAEEAGQYDLQLDIATDDGTQTVERSIAVVTAKPFVIERVGPSRINPKQPYVMHLFVTPDVDYRGTFTELVPRAFEVLDVSGGGRSEQQNDDTTKLVWEVDWKAGQEVELTYVFDAPDVSPAVFELGPSTSTLAKESSAWTVASDEVVERKGTEFAYAAVEPTADDWQPVQDNLVETSKAIYRDDEILAIKLWTDGFADDSAPEQPVDLQNVEIVSPDGSTLAVNTATERFAKDGRERVVLYAAPPDDLPPGQYVARATRSDGSTVESAFEWGTLQIDSDKDQPKKKTRLTFDVSTLGDDGRPSCADALKLTVQEPGGESRVFSSDDGSIVVCRDGQDVAEVEYSPSEVGIYSMELRRNRGGQERFVTTTIDVGDRPATPPDIRSSMERAVETEAETFAVDEAPRLRVNVLDKATFGLLGVDSVVREVTNIVLVDPNGTVVGRSATRTQEQRRGSTDELLELNASSFSRAGRYVARIDIEQDQYAETIEQDFTWGVLAVNVPRSIELPNHDTTIGLAVLDDTGRTLCRTSVSVAVTNPAGKTEQFSTGDGTIKLDPTCVDKGVTNNPDYSLSYKTGTPGTYRLKATAITPNGTRSFNDSFVVQTGAGFDVERTAFPTRIFPIADYPVLFTITPRQDYVGTVVEALPSSFGVSAISDRGAFAAVGERTEVIWTVDWKAGETYTLGYTMDPPNISPEFYRLGPLTIGDPNGIGGVLFQEARQWQIASDGVSPNGWAVYGSQDTGEVGKLQLQKITNPSTLGGEINTALGGGSTTISWVKIVQDPTGTEASVAYIDTGGTMYVLRCTSACDTAGNWSELFNVASVTGAQTCTADPSTSCQRPFDIAYEQLKGRLMIAYGKSATTNAFFYRVYDEGAVVTAETQVTEANLGTAAPTFITLHPRGERLSDTRDNQILAVIMAAGTNHEVVGEVWDGSSAWGTSVHATATTKADACDQTQCADGGWETVSGDKLIVWSETGGTNYKYRRHTGGAWASEANSAVTRTTSGNDASIQMDSAPNTNRVLMVGHDRGNNDLDVQTWKADGSTAAWADDGSRTDVESSFNLSIQAHGFWEQNSTDAIVLYGLQGLVTLDTAQVAITCDGTGCTPTWTDIADTTATCTGFSAADDNNSVHGGASWNSDEVWFLHADADQNLWRRQWTGSAVETAQTDCLEGNLINATNNAEFGGMPFAFTYVPYSVWSTNWHYYNGTDTTDTPTTSLANENVVPTNFNRTNGKFRLRFAAQERSAGAQVDARKKLQYATADPNLLTTTWTDVDDPAGAGIWRYVDCNGGSAVCNDGQGLAGTVLGGTPTAGWWVQDKDAAATTNMDQAGSVHLELEFSVEANNAAASTTYYFRMYDLDQSTPVYRLQTNNPATPCTGSVACAYPSLTTNAPGIDISGTCSAYDQTTACTDVGTVAVAVNGVLQAQNQPTVAGTWTISAVAVSSGNIVTVFIDAAATAADRAVAVTKYDGTGNITGVTLFKEHLTIGSDDNQTLTNTNLGSYDNSVSVDADVFHEVNATDDLTVDSNASSTQEELYIATGDIYQPASAGGADVNTVHIEIVGTLTADSNAINVSGNWVNSGTFTAGTSTVTLNGAAAQTLTHASQVFSTLTINNTGADGATDDVTAGTGTLDVNSTFNVTNGDLKLNTNNPAVSTAGNVTIGASAFVTKGTGAWTFDGTTATTYTDSTATPQNIGAVTINKTDTVAPATNDKVTLASSMTTDTVTIDGTAGQADTLDLAASGYTLTLANAGATATVLTVNGTLTIGTSTIKYTATNSAANINVNLLAYSSLEVAGAETYDLTGNQTAANDIDANLTIGSGAILDATATNYNIDVAGNWSNSGTFTARAGTVTLDGAAAQTLTHASQVFSTLTINNTGADGATDDVTAGTGTLDVNSTFNVTNGDLKLNTNNPNVTTAGSVTIGASAFVTKGTGTWTFDGTTATTYTDSTATPQNIGVVTFNKTDTVAPGTNNKVTLASSMTADRVTIDGTVGSPDTLDLAAAGYTLTLANAGATATVLTVSGTLTIGTSTIKYTATNSAANITVNLLAYSSLEVAGTETYDLAGHQTGANDIDANLTIGAGAILDATATNYNLEVAGNWSNLGTFTARAGTVTFDAVATGKTIAPGSSSFYNLIFNGSGGGWSNSAAMTVANDLTMTAGELSGTNNVTVNGVVSGTAGTINKTGGTFEQRISATPKTFGPSTASTSWTFSILTFSNGNGGATAVTVNTTSCVTCGITVSSVLNIGKSGDAVGATTTLNAGDKTWTLSGSGAGASRPFVLLASPAGALTASTSTFNYTGTAATDVQTAAYSGLGVGTASDSSVVTYTVTANSSASGTVTISNAGSTGTDSLSINTGIVFTHSGATLTLTANGKITGAGTYVYQSATAFPTTGTIDSILRMDMTSNNQTLSARTYDGLVEGYNNSSTANRTLTLGTAASQTLTFSGAFNPRADNNGDVFVDGGTNNPTVNITGALDFTGSGNGTEVLAAGNGTWTVSGDVNFTDGIYGPQIASITPSWDDAGVNSLLWDDFCLSSTDTKSCQGSGASTLNIGFNNASAGQTICPSTDVYSRAGMKFSLASISDSATILDTKVTLKVETATTTPVGIYLTEDAIDVRSCIGAGTDNVYLQLSSGALYVQASDYNATGVKITDLGATADADVKTRLTGSDVIALGFVSPELSSPTGTLTSSEGTSNTPKLRVAYTTATTSTLVMNGASRTLTSAGNTLYNLTFSGTTATTLTGSVTAAGTVVLNSTVTAGTLTMTGIGGKNLTGGAATLTNLTIDPQTAATITLQTSDLTVSTLLTVAASDTLSLSSNLTLSAASGTSLGLNGTISGAGRLTYKNATAFPTAGTISSILRFDATSVASQIISSRTYGGAVEIFNSGGTAKTVASNTGTMAFSSTLELLRADTATVTLDLNTTDPTTTTVTGALTIGAGATLSAPSTNALNVKANYTNNGTFTDNLGTVTVNGTSQQTLGGTMTGTSDFNNLTITNASGTDPETSPSVIFAASAATTATGTVTATTANVKIRFLAGGTYTFQNISFNGQATGTRVFLRSSTNGTQWNLNVAGTRTVSNTNVKDSNACGQAPDIDASNGTNVDAANNSCWNMNTLTFTVDDNTIGFGTLTTANGRWATGTTGSNAPNGTTIPDAAHTMTIATNAPSGWAITYNGALLTSGANNIDAATIVDDSDGTPNTEQFGISASTSGNSTITSGYLRDASASFNFVASTTTTLVSESVATATETITVSALANISGITPAGSYSTTITYVASGLF